MIPWTDWLTCPDPHQFIKLGIAIGPLVWGALDFDPALTRFALMQISWCRYRQSYGSTNVRRIGDWEHLLLRPDRLFRRECPFLTEVGHGLNNRLTVRDRDGEPCQRNRDWQRCARGRGANFGSIESWSCFTVNFPSDQYISQNFTDLQL